MKTKVTFQALVPEVDVLIVEEPKGTFTVYLPDDPFDGEELGQTNNLSDALTMGQIWFEDLVHDSVEYTYETQTVL